MDRTVIALRGAANVGKSNTINKVYDLLLSRYSSASREYEIRKADIRVILTINGIKVGIESQGDPGSRLKKSLSLFAEADCTVIICATRTSGQTVDAVKELQSRYNVIWLQQVVESNASGQEASNDAMARRIIGEVEKVIGVITSGSTGAVQ